MAHLAVVSFRLGHADGVSVEARKWIDALCGLGHEVTTVAGEGDADVVVPSIAIDADRARRDELEDALEGADVVIVENLVSLPLNPSARDVLYELLEHRPAIFHHHDLPWQRERFRDAEGPRDAPWWRHVTINELSRKELTARGIEATTIYNRFDCDPPKGRRDLARAVLEIEGAPLLAMPTRALPRKNVEGAIELCRALDATLWLVGPAEDGYGAELDELLARAKAAVRRGLPIDLTIEDVYAAADLVVLPSTWEGFGNPVLESVTHRRPLAVYPYPVLGEIRSFGFEFFDLNDVTGLRGFLQAPVEALLARNLEVARRHFNLKDLPPLLAAELTALGVDEVPIG